MNIIIWVVVGGIIGWLGSLVMRTNQERDLLLNVGWGIGGAALGGWFLNPLFGAPVINQDHFSFPGLLESLLGAVILLAIVNFTRERLIPRNRKRSAWRMRHR